MKYPFRSSFAATLMAASALAPSATAATAVPSRVVFVHGIFQSGRMFGPLVRKLEDQGCECLVPKLTPADARQGIEPLAEQLKSAIEHRWDDNARIHIVAHSMGGLISREYLQHLGGHARCLSLTTLATPHHGTLAAFCYPGKGAMQMRAGSTFLANLQSTEHRLHDIELRSFYTPMDLIILPYTSSRWEMAENESVLAPAHPLVLFSPRVVKRILQMGYPSDLTN